MIREQDFAGKDRGVQQFVGLHGVEGDASSMASGVVSCLDCEG